jgi:uncharacterized protein (DUF433 family)
MSSPLLRARAAAEGCYEAGRAAALSGVPKSTVYYWARHGVVVPSVSPVQEKLWSFADLMAIRVVSWLRHPKPGDSGEPLPASPMSKVRRGLFVLSERGLDLWDPDFSGPSPLVVDRRGEIFVSTPDEVVNLHGQPVLLPAETLGLTAPFTRDGHRGPDLLRPRPTLRIVPSKVSGEPHIEKTRLTTQTIAALAARGFDPGEIAAMYDQPVSAVADALDLERQLGGTTVAA